MLLELLKTKGKHILLGDFNLYHSKKGGIIVININNIINDFICTIKATNLNLFIKMSIKI